MLKTPPTEAVDLLCDGCYMKHLKKLDGDPKIHIPGTSHSDRFYHDLFRTFSSRLRRDQIPGVEKSVPHC